VPKLKTKRGAAKRFKITKSGRIGRKKACASHILTKKSSKRKRGLRQADVVSKADRKAIKLLLPYA